MRTDAGRIKGESDADHDRYQGGAKRLADDPAAAEPAG